LKHSSAGPTVLRATLTDWDRSGRKPTYPIFLIALKEV
jgi:hypothetical protein